MFILCQFSIPIQMFIQCDIVKVYLKYYTDREVIFSNEFMDLIYKQHKYELFFQMTKFIK